MEDIWAQQRAMPGNRRASIVAHDRRRIGSDTVDKTDDISHQVRDVLGLHRLGLVGLAIAALIGRDDSEARRRKRRNLMTE